MKRIGGLFECICARETLVRAAWRAARGKRDRAEVRAFLADGERNLNRMQQALAIGTYRFSGYHCFEVRDTKRRTIHAPPFQDRVVHHAMMAVVGPVLERGALAHSYACRVGRGQHAALAQAERWIRRGDWYGKMDVRRFYDSVDHACLKVLLARRLREARLLALFDALLGSYQTTPGHGLPIGALTSQYLGNFYLDPFDHGLKRTGLAARYLRYMDDGLVIGTRDEVAGVRAAASRLLQELGLVLKHGGEWNRISQGVPLLGFVLYPACRRVSRVGRRRFRRKLRALARAHAAGEVDEASAQARAASLAAHVAQGNDVAWRRGVLHLHDFGSALAPPEGDTPRRQPGDPRRRLEQHRQELPRRLPQQEEARQSEPEPGLSGWSVSRHEDGEQKAPSTDGACSRSAASPAVDEGPRKSPPDVDIRTERGGENTPGGAASRSGG